LVLLIATRRQAWGVLLVIVLSPQIWYVFSYFNGDALPFFLSMLLVVALGEENGPLARYVEGERRMGLAVTGFAVCLGLLLISKRNFLPVVPGVVLWLSIRHLAMGWPSLLSAVAGLICVAAAVSLLDGPLVVSSSIALSAVGLVLLGASVVVLWFAGAADVAYRKRFGRIAVLVVIAILVAAPRVAFDVYQNGPPGAKSERIEAVREAHARPEFRPSALEAGTSYHGLWLARKERPFTEVLFEPYRWVEKSAQSAFGVYGYMNIFAPGWTYVVLAGITAALFVLAALALLRSDAVAGGRYVFLSCSVCGLVFLISALHSWVFDFQAQGRYLLPAFAMMGLMTGTARQAMNGVIARSLLAMALTVSLGVFVFVGIAAFGR
jgi:hypothetical protein